MKPTIIEDEIFEFEPFEEDGSELMAADYNPGTLARSIKRFFN